MRNRVRRLWLDAVIGWNQGHAERLEQRARAARRRECVARLKYHERYMTRWLP
jgi:hypothetical protein